ncbi:hypothetical protein FJ959_09090 [Mesorhizobium sp. B2-2-4]|uniref:hypothetical protein n=1 Tax=unclassified Mesorhizobium TaxID=325217 RepID=UPI0011273E90|nr:MULTISPECIES: hypothetical protein [unclassified Mesorhizobium]TPM59016.1 hypothetical protein FJ959_09090 [Mesorhizobium sp. B2-2-4]TPM67501.1 hypothetical protein FJ965_10230 [Mesorhizobium sp. B2-2-1]
MTAANDNDPFARLPLFASDKDIAAAIVGRAKMEYWLKAVLPTIERRGFPAVDALHGGRPVPLVRKFYEGYFGITAGFAMAKPDGEERLGGWKTRNKKAA